MHMFYVSMYFTALLEYGNVTTKKMDITWSGADYQNSCYYDADS